MARAIMCDAGDGQPAAYLITDQSNGDTFAPCTQHWVDLCASVTRAAEEAMAGSAPATVPQPIDPPADPSDPDNDVQQADRAGDGGVGDDEDDPGEGCPFCGLVVPPAGQEAHIRAEHLDASGQLLAGHEARVHAELAARPDAPATSEAVTWTPEGSDA